MSRREMDRPTPALWWSPKLDVFVGEHRTESGNYEVIGYDRDGWYVAEEQEIELPPDAVVVRSAAGSPATAQPPAAVLRGLLAEARALIDLHLGDRSQTARVLLRRIDAATTDDAQEGQG